MHVYKTFVKCTIGLIGNNQLIPFSKTIDWLRYWEGYRDLPKVVVVEVWIYGAVLSCVCLLQIVVKLRGMIPDRKSFTSRWFFNTAFMDKESKAY